MPTPASVKSSLFLMRRRSPFSTPVSRPSSMCTIRSRELEDAVVVRDDRRCIACP